MTDYWRSDVQWKLSAADVRRVLALRSDFAASAVAALRL